MARHMKWKAGQKREILKELVLQYGLRCWYCGIREEQLEKFSNQTWHIDHIVPLAQGGPSHISNYAIACPMCNRAKFDMSKQDFLEWLEYVRILCSPVGSC